MTAADDRKVTPGRSTPLSTVAAPSTITGNANAGSLNAGPTAEQLRTMVAAAEARGVERGYRRAVDRLREEATADILDDAFAEGWHRYVCACDVWPEKCLTYPNRGGTPLGHAPDTHPVADVLDRVALYLEAIEGDDRADTQ